MGNYRCYVFLALVLLWDLCLAISNSTQFEPTFVPEPRGRGTIGILWSCVITLGLCVWTSVHPDVIPNPTTRRTMIHRVIWMFIALFAPEFLVGYASKQRERAKLIHSAWCAHFKIKPGSPEDKMRMEGAFFAVMGGFVVNVGDPEAGEGSESLTCHRALTTEGFLHYLSKNQIPLDSINKKEIVDKGKADIIAKFLVCLQALWMVIQASVRKASGLPITLLELHVVIQVMFVLMTYTQWGYKPLSANEPIILSLQGEVGVAPADNFRPVRKDRNSILDLTSLIETNWKGESSSNAWAVVGALVITSAAHTSAWNYAFPTHAEQVMWRVSSISLAGPSLVCVIWGWKWLGRPLNKTVSTSYLIVGSIFLPLYLLAIIFIIVEAFISLRKVPLGTYDSVQWMDFWPHV